MIDRHIKKTLNLAGVEIQSQNPIRSGTDQKVGHELCRNRNARLVLPVLPRIAIKRQNGGDPRCGSPAGGVN